MQKSKVAKAILIIFLVTIIVGSTITIYNDITKTNVKTIQQQTTGYATVGIYVNNQNNTTTNEGGNR